MKELSGIGNSLSVAVLAVATVLTGLVLLAVPPGVPDALAVTAYSRAHYVLSPDALNKGVAFAGVSIPLDRKEVAERVVEQINYLLMDRRAGMLEWFDRMAVYGPMIRQVLEDEKVPEDMIYLAALLGDLLPNFRSKTGGIGWWALGPIKQEKNQSLVQWVSTNDWDDRRDPVLSTRIACTSFQWLYRRKPPGDWLLAICAFLDGTDKIDTIVKNAADFSYWDLVVPSRSEVMIPRLIALKLIATHREFYGVDSQLPPPLACDSLDRLKLEKDLPLHVVAQWCGTNPRAIWELNPGVDPSTGVLPKPDKRSPSGFPLRVPKGMEGKVRKLLIKEGYLAG